jgi:hypothetical protein
MTQLIGDNIDNINNIEIIRLYVKKVFTTKTKTYIINPNATLKEIMSEILNNAVNDFDMEENDLKELVEAGQCIPGIKSENAPALELNYPDETFKQRFNNSYKNVAFYIRKG